MSAAQIARLKLIGEQMEVELITADLSDDEILQALKAIVLPVAKALNIDPSGSLVLDAVICHDQSSGGWYGLCATCGIVTVMWEERYIARTSLERHMEHKHSDFEYVVKEMATS